MEENLRQMPSDISSEMAIIGCIITKSETIDQAIQLVKPYEFYDSRCQRIYKTLVKIRKHLGGSWRRAVYCRDNTLLILYSKYGSILWECQRKSSP